MKRRLFSKLAVTGVWTLTGAFTGTRAAASEYPQHAITIVNPFAAGGSLDILCRMLAKMMSETIGQAVIVENRPGAASVIGSQYVANAKADGYTILAQASNFVVAPALGAPLPYDWRRDFVAISQLGSIAQALSVPESSPLRNVAELVKFAKLHPGEVTYGSLGQGSGGHVTAAQFEQMAGIRLTQVPFKGMSQTLAALAGGHIQMAFGNLPEILHYQRLGRVRPLALGSKTRSPLAPDLPTMSEVGFPGFVAEPWYGVLAPAETPKPVVDRIHQELLRVLKQPEIEVRLREMGIRSVGSTPQAFQQFMESEFATFVKVGREAKIQLN
ncbi:MAG: Bug family tripartite tricarboxylate transporter substrate binding protein [Thermomicrobiales bacterium]